MTKPVPAAVKPGFNLDEFKAGLKIDKNKLDDELQFQPGLFFEVSEHLALSRSRLDAAKSELAQQEAEVELDIRQEAKDKEDKVTEAQVKAMVATDPEVLKYQDEVRALNQQVNRLFGLKEAYEQRKSMLDMVVRLYLANYYDRVQASSIRSAPPSDRRLAERALADQAAARASAPPITRPRPRPRPQDNDDDEIPF